MLKRAFWVRSQLWTRLVTYAEALWPGEGLKGVPHLVREALRRYVERSNGPDSDRN